MQAAPLFAYRARVNGNDAKERPMTTQTPTHSRNSKRRNAKRGRHLCRSKSSTTPPAAKLVKFAAVDKGQQVLDVACGTGVVAVTAARRGAKVSGLDLSPALIERARKNAEHCRRRNRFHRGRRRGAALSGCFVRCRAQPIRSHFRAAAGCRGEGDAAGAEGRRPHRVLDLAAGALHRANVRVHRAPCATTSAGRGCSGPAAAMGRSERCDGIASARW